MPPTDRFLVPLSTSIPAAFGAVQLHQTTRWSIEMLEKYYCGGCVLDVGTGAGLLAICTARLSRDNNRIIEAFDIYSDAVRQARINIRLNQLTKKISLRRG